MRGCQPKKYLVAAAEVAHLSHQMARIGIQPVAQIDWPALMRSKAAFTDAVPDRTVKDFQKLGIEQLHGTAHFISPDEVAVDSGLSVRAEHIVIATGSKTARLDIPGADLTVTSDEFLELAQWPRRVAFIGGGYIAMEFAHVAHAAGAKVSVLQRSNRILKRFDAELASQLLEASLAGGITLTMRFDVCSVEKSGSAFNIFAMAMKFGLSNQDLKKVLWAYPTNVSDLKYMIN